MTDRLIYLPLGGAGEIGMNAYVYGYGKPGKERLIVVDLGVTFPDMDGSPGVDLILPDIAGIIGSVLARLSTPAVSPLISRGASWPNRGSPRMW